MGLDALVGLKRLELTGCRQLSEAPAGLPPSLETLCLGPFREGSSLVVDISKLSQLRVLKLKCVGVVCGHAAAERLLVLGQQGPIQQLEQEFEGVSQAPLNQLEELEMRLQGMSQEFLLPSNVLPRLRSLLIDAPGICSLPVNMAAAVPDLRQLKLLSWAPEELPRAILELSRLTSLTIHAPQLTSLPEGVSCLSRLRKVESRLLLNEAVVAAVQVHRQSQVHPALHANLLPYSSLLLVLHSTLLHSTSLHSTSLHTNGPGQLVPSGEGRCGQVLRA
ncbi:unnamed protein product [Closterium sp. NIES-64]|nr:unnamed protein product [Closterium sp. NIES-64]